MAAAGRADVLRSKIQTQGTLVAELKKNKATLSELEAAVKQLGLFKEELRSLVDAERAKDLGGKEAAEKIRTGLENLMVQRFFVIPSFEIYGGVAGLYDFGPPGCAIRDNVIALWKRHFVLEEGMLEIFTSALTPEIVLKTSGHVDRFTDLMVKDVKTGECFRADKLLEEVIDNLLEDINITDSERKEHLANRSKAGDLNAAQMDDMIKRYDAKSLKGNELSPAFPFNLMFETPIGPSGKLRGFMRPETAQGIFTNFKRLLEYNNSRMPFAGAQIGPAFRNEISPRAGLLRVREFTLAEIEHFVHPNDKSHPKFASVADIAMTLLDKSRQGKGTDEPLRISAGEAVKAGLINNETLAYFMVRTQLFLTKIGIKFELLRFRQHKDTEMAHYASDCWDAEIKSSYGWVECVGHADRSCYDLERHAAESKVDLSAAIEYSEPRIVRELKAKVNKGKMGPKFRGDAPKVASYLSGLGEAEAMSIEKALAETGKVTVNVPELSTPAEITRDMVSYSIETESRTREKFIPAVIEPSFGVGRILYSLLEHAYYVRDGDDQRRVLQLRPCVAPIKIAILPLSNHEDLKPFVNSIYDSLISRGIATQTDASSASVGKRYARADEVGIPFGVTVDFDTVKKNSVTIRERDSLTQVRVTLDELADVCEKLALEKVTWTQIYDTYPKFFAQESSSS